LGVVEVKDDLLFYKAIRHDERKTMQIDYGQFGEVHKNVEEKCGEKFATIKLVAKLDENKEVEMLGVVDSCGKKATIMGLRNVFVMEWVTKEEKIKLESQGDPIEAPPGPYKIQPEYQGKLLWLIGSPGVGKSTSAQLMAKNRGFVYYEGDCFINLKNPYIPLDVAEPTMDQFKQNNLIGDGLKERKEINNRASTSFQKVFEGWDFTFDDSEGAENHRAFFKIFAEDIVRERKRIGGDWAVASAHVLNKDWRQFVRSFIGPDLLYVNLVMSEEAIRKRIEKRHNDDNDTDKLMKIYNLHQSGTSDDEEGMIKINIDEKMTENDVVQLICIESEKYYKNLVC